MAEYGASHSTVTKSPPHHRTTARSVHQVVQIMWGAGTSRPDLITCNKGRQTYTVQAVIEGDKAPFITIVKARLGDSRESFDNGTRKDRKS